MVYREEEKPVWRCVAITSHEAERMLESAGGKPSWIRRSSYMTLAPADMTQAVTMFLNRLADTGVPPEHVKVTFHPEEGDSGGVDPRSKYVVFYFGLHEIDPV